MPGSGTDKLPFLLLTPTYTIFAFGVTVRQLPRHAKTVENVLWGLLVVSLTESGNAWKMGLWECRWGFSSLC